MPPRVSVIFALALFLVVTLWAGHAVAYKNMGSGSAAVPCNSYYEASVAYNYTSKTVEFCNGTAWGNLLGASGGITLGTSATATSPQVSGDPTTGLFSAAASTVSIATGGVEALRVNSAQNIDIGASGDLGLYRNAANVLEVNNGTKAQWAAIKSGVRDAGTTTVTNGLTIGHQSSGTPAAGLGSAILFNVDDSTTADQNAAQIAGVWTTATHASRTSALTFSTVNSAAALSEAMRITGAGYVGIAATSPAYTLDVAGGIAVAGFGRNVNNTNIYMDSEHSYGPSNAPIVSIYSSGADVIAGLGIGLSNVTSSPDEYAVITQAMAGSWNGVAPVTSGTYLPGIGFAGQTDGNAGTGMAIGAAIVGLVDNTVSSGHLPTSLVFRTSTTNHSGLTNRMVITSGGNVGIGTTSPSALFSVGNTNQFTVDSNGSVIVAGNSTHGNLSIQQAAGGYGPSLNLYAKDDGDGGWNIAQGGSEGSYGHALLFLHISQNPTLIVGDNKIAINGTNGTSLLAPLNTLDVLGGAAIGSYAGVNSAPSNGLIVSGNVGIGSTSPAATLDVNGYARLAKNSSQPVACSAANDGAIALTHVYTLCICNGGSTSWVQSKDGSTACSW